MKSKFSLSDSIISRLNREYDFIISKHTQLKGGFANYNFKIQTDKGNYFLRIHDLISDLKAIEQEHKLMVFLSEKKFLSPKIIKTLSNKTYNIVDNKIFSVYSWIDGKPPQGLTNNTISQAGQKLAEYHNIVSEFTEDVPKWGLSIHQKPKETINHTLEGFIRIIFKDMPWERSAYKILEEKTKLNSFENEIIRLKPFLNRIKEDIEAQFKSIKLNDRVIIMHGDYWKNNLLFKNDVLVGIVDFDTARAGNSKFELMKGALEFSEFKINKIKIFIKNYIKIRNIKISVEEIELYLQILSMWQIGQNIKKPILGNRKPVKDEIDTIRKHVSFLKKLNEYEDWKKGLEGIITEHSKKRELDA